MIQESEFKGDRKRVAQISVGMLFIVNMMSQLDRQIMSVLAEPIRKDLSLSDTEIGVVVGIAFAVFYTLAGLPLGRLADRTNRKNLIATVLSFWSLATAACGLAQGYWQLFAARIGVGIGEAGCAPAAQSMLSELFPRERLGRALSTYQSAIPIGIFVGLAGGGYLADNYHWRTVFMIIGLPGLVVAAIAFFVLREPEREHGGKAETVGQGLRFLFRMPSLRQHMLACSIQTMTLAATATFNFPFMVRVHGLSMTEAGLVIGLVTGICGGFGTYFGGWLGDRLARHDPRWRIGCIGVGAVASVPVTVFAYLTDSLPLSILGISIGVIGSYMYSGAAHAVSQSLVKSHMRAMTAAAMLFAMNLFGYGGGPVFAGIISDYFGGEEALRYALALMNGLLLWAGFHYYLATRTYCEDLARQEAR